MRLTEHPVLKFDTLLPLYNWIYPLSGRPVDLRSDRDPAEVLRKIPPSRSRALYVHVPFCETICTFCPFVRAAEHDEDVVEGYVRALIHEIELKARIPALTRSPVGAVFFGGGTPSLLKPEQILAIGAALRSCFDLSACREFSLEFEVKSVTLARVQAAREVGVTHARFGAQTFSTAFRRLFNLTASVEQLVRAAEVLRSHFDHTSCDMLYGMHGQSEEELFDDIQQAAALGLTNLDFYPINNLVTQPRLNRDLRLAGRKQTSGLTKFYMTMFVRQILRQLGYLPHNGHGYVRVDEDELRRAPLITDAYSFVYHEHTLGYPDYDLLGFGVNAISSFRGCAVSNDDSRDDYIRRISADELPITITEHPPFIDACRPVALALPYHGRIPRSWVDAERVPRDVIDRLGLVIEHGLVAEVGDEYTLTREGLDWYTNLMFYLLPRSEQAALEHILRVARDDPRRSIESSGLEEYDFRRSLPLVDG